MTATLWDIIAIKIRNKPRHKSARKVFYNLKLNGSKLLRRSNSNKAGGGFSTIDVSLQRSPTLGGGFVLSIYLCNKQGRPFVVRCRDRFFSAQANINYARFPAQSLRTFASSMVVSGLSALGASQTCERSEVDLTEALIGENRSNVVLKARQSLRREFSSCFTTLICSFT